MADAAVVRFEPAYAQLANADKMPERRLSRLYGRMLGGQLIKTTRAGRFEQLDHMLAEAIDARFPRDTLVRVHDLAASNAITSVELFRFLSARRPVEVKASDYYDAVWRTRTWGLDVIFDADRRPLQVGLGRLAISAQRGRMHPAVARWCERSANGLEGAQKISLFHPVAQRLAAEDARFRLAREDFFNPAAETFEAVRMLNAIWPSFSPEQASAALRAVAGTLVDNGLLVLGRAGNYSLYAKEAGRLVEVAAIGDRTENAALVAALGN